MLFLLKMLFLFALFQRLYTAFADAIISKRPEIGFLSTEHTTWLIPPQDDFIPLNEQFNRIANIHPECSAQFNGKNNPAQVVHIADNTC